MKVSEMFRASSSAANVRNHVELAEELLTIELAERTTASPKTGTCSDSVRSQH
jgi:hypothetical protein